MTILTVLNQTFKTSGKADRASDSRTIQANRLSCQGMSISGGEQTCLVSKVKGVRQVGKSSTFPKIGRLMLEV